MESMTTTTGNDVITTSSSCPREIDSPSCTLYSFVISTVVMGLLAMFGTAMAMFGSVGNIVSFAVFWRDKIKTSTSFLFQALSVIDTLMLATTFPIFCIPTLCEYTGWYSSYYDFGYQLALVHVLPFVFIIQTSTIWVTVLVGINRYIAVCMPYQAVRLCTVAKARRQLATVLILAVLYNAPKFAEGKLEHVSDGVACAVHTELIEQKWYLIVYGNVFYTVFMLVIPLATLTFLNVRLIAALKDVHQKRRQMQSARQQHDNNVTLVLIVVVIVFSVCQFPALVTQLSWNVLPNSARLCGGFQFYFSRISNALVVTNSAVNFLIYFRFNKRFRSVLTQMVFGSESATVGKRHPLLSGRPVGDASGGAGGRGPTTGGPAIAMPSPSMSTVGALPRRSNHAGDHRLSVISGLTSTKVTMDQNDVTLDVHNTTL